MFDTYLRHSTPDVRVNVNIPQPDAADHKRLYGELLKEARKEVATATIADLGAYNEVKVIKIEHHDDFLNQRLKFRLLFNVNGKQYDIITDIDSMKTDVNEILLHAVFNQALEKMGHYDKVKLLGK